MTAEKKSEIFTYTRCLWFCNTIYHQLVAVVTVFVVWIACKNYDLNKKILWHIVLTMLAYIPLMAEGFVLFADTNVWSLKLNRTVKYYIHGLFLLNSTVILTAGIFIEYDAKKGFKHFQSDHAITGLASWILALIACLLGFFASNAQKLQRFVRPVILKFVHNFIGIACFAIGIASLCLGFDYGSFNRYVTTREHAATVWLVGIISIWSVIVAFRSAYNQIKAILS